MTDNQPYVVSDERHQVIIMWKVYFPGDPMRARNVLFNLHRVKIMFAKTTKIMLGSRTKVSAFFLVVGVATGILVSYGWAGVTGPSEHKGLEVEVLGSVPAESVYAQVGLEGHTLLLRRITIKPGGQIAKHSAAKVPGVVYMATGTWTEGRDSGETEHSAGDTFIEDENTVHWFYNRGNEPATAYVCDIKPTA